MYMRRTCLNSCSVDVILVVFADLFRKKANKRKIFPSAVAWNITNSPEKLQISREYDTPGWISQSSRVFQFLTDRLSRSASIYRIAPCLRWLEIVFSTYIVMGRCNHSLSLDATIMVSKNCLTIGEIFFIYWQHLISTIRCNFWQSLKKFHMGFRATLNIRIFKVALNPMYRIF